LNLKNSITISFSVEGRPPRKYRNKSVWSTNEEAPIVKKLREHAIKARNDAGINDYFHGPVKLELTVFSQNISNISASHEYVGDLDAFIAGICESLQPANEQAPIHSVFKNTTTIYPNLPILFEDDSQVVKINAKKSKNEKTFYELSITELENM